MVIGDITGRDLARLLTLVREKTGREINPAIMRGEELREKIARADPFVQIVLRKPKTFLIGGENELRELAGAGTSEGT
jgi:hypothetical protein